ncbi:MAG: VTT domain-containing protein [Acidobacteria bacterium]|nr:VTT domain-containing protein [Acidobacteriota bacterium]
MRHLAKAIIFVLGIFAFIVIPFLIWGDQLTSLIENSLNSSPTGTVAVVLCLVLLATDVVLPIPSSLVSTAAGYLLGFWGGVAASTMGMSLGCLLGYVLGDKLGTPLAARFINPQDFALISGRLQAAPYFWLVLLRPIPVLAEASCLVAGTAKVQASGFLLWTTVANLGISVVYAAVGSKAVEARAALVVALALPALMMLLARAFRKRY